MKGGGELREAGVERQRQRGEQGVAGVVLEVLRDALAAGHHVAMRQHHALGPAGAAGRIQDGRHVGVDDAVARCGRRSAQFVPAHHAGAGQLGQGVDLAGEHHVAQVVAAGERVAQGGEALGRGHQHAHVAVLQDVADLFGLEDRVDRHEHAARRAGTEEGGDGVRALVEVDRDALAVLEAQRQQAGSEAAEFGVELGVALGGARERQRRGVGIALGRSGDQVVEQGGVVHGGRMSRRRAGPHAADRSGAISGRRLTPPPPNHNGVRHADGVRWRPIGVRLGRFPDQSSLTPGIASDRSAA